MMTLTTEIWRGCLRGSGWGRLHLGDMRDALSNVKGNTTFANQGNFDKEDTLCDLDLPERIKRYTSSRKEEEEDGQNCLCGKGIESRSHVVAECEYKEERKVLEGKVRDVNEGDMKSFDALDSREKTMAILGDRW